LLVTLDDDTVGHDMVAELELDDLVKAERILLDNAVKVELMLLDDEIVDTELALERDATADAMFGVEELVDDTVGHDMVEEELAD
jgi:hypothetical protein